MLPGRALETVILLLGVLVVSVFGLAPGQSHRTLGIEVPQYGCASRRRSKVGKVDGRRRLAYTAFDIRDRDDLHGRWMIVQHRHPGSRS